MLKLKFLIGLLMIATLTVAMALFSVSLLRTHITKIDQILAEDLDAINVVKDLPLFASRLANEYFAIIAETGESTSLPDASLLPTYREAYRRPLEKLRQEVEDSPEGMKAAAEAEALAGHLDHFLNQFEKLHAAKTLTPSARLAYEGQILKANSQIEESAEKLLQYFRFNIKSEGASAIIDAKQSIRFLLTSMIGALVLMAFLYIQIGRSVIRPVEQLTISLREVQKSNFESTVPVKSKDEVGRVASAFNDMAAALQLQQSEKDHEILKLTQEYHAIMTGFPHPIFFLNHEGKLSHANPEAQELMSKLGTTDALPEKVAVRFEEAHKNRQDHLPDDISEAMLLRVEENEFWYLPRIFQIGSEEEGFQGWAVVIIDVSRFRWMDDMKSNLIGTISHEIKTPLTSIRMILHLLAEQKTGELNPTQERMVDSANNDCERLLRTLENLLQLSRMERGAAHLERQPTKPEELANEVATDFSTHLASKDTELKIQIEGNLPHVPADRHQIIRVLTNFLSNALKHNVETEPIILAARKLGPSYIRFSVIDHGNGVPPAEQDRIFERFYRARGEKTKGSGIGLSICREIIHAHDGRIGVISSPNEPTEFYFDLPLNQ